MSVCMSVRVYEEGVRERERERLNGEKSKSYKTNKATTVKCDEIYKEIC